MFLILPTNKKIQSFLNEAAYTGFNLMGDMLNLLIRFRIQKYVLLADIKKVFLIIRSDLEKNQNCCGFF